MREVTITTSVKATPAHRFLCAVGDWDDYLPGRSTGTQKSIVGLASGYKRFGLAYSHAHVFLSLRASANDVIELQSIIAYPDRIGNGSRTMLRLCDLADELAVTIWLNAFPYGRDREHISLSRLKKFYLDFGFFCVRTVDRRWLTTFHELYDWDKSNLMMRRPAAQIVSDDLAGQGSTCHAA